MNTRLAILVKRFPKLSETFIKGEIDNLIGRGLDVSILSLFEPTEELRQPSSSALLSRVRYLTQVSQTLAWRKLLVHLLRTPRAWAAVIRFRKNGGSTTSLAKLLELCSSEEIRHIHAHYLSEPSALAEIVFELTGIPFSISAHAKDIYLTEDVEIKRRVGLAKFISTCTRHNLGYLKKLVSEPKKVQLNYHGIDTDFFHNSNSKQTLPPLLVSVGRFKRKKGFDVLIDACNILTSRNIEFQCEIIGYGDEADALQSQIEKCGLLSKVKLKPPAEHSQLVSVLNKASIFVMPCRITKDGDRDGIPNSMLEAMACEVPIVSTFISGIPEVIQNGKNGALVRSDAPEELADELSKLIADSEARKNLGRAGRETVVNRFGWQSNISPLVKMLEESLASSQPIAKAAS